MTRPSLLTLGIALCITAAPLQAQLWEGGTSSDWNTASNWNPAFVPLLTSARVNTNAGNMPNIGSGVDAFPFALEVGFDGNSGSNTKLTIEPGGKFTAISLTIGVNSGSQGALFSSGGQLLVNSLIVGNAGKALLDLRGGSDLKVQGLLVGIGGGESVVRVSGAETKVGRTAGDTDGFLGIASAGHVIVENGAAMELYNAVVLGGRFTVRGSDSRYSDTGNISFAVLNSGLVEVEDGGEISTSGLFLDDSRLLVRGDRSNFESKFIYARNSSSISLEDRGSLLVDGVTLIDRAKVEVRDGASLVDSRFFDASDDSKLLVESGGFVVIKELFLESYARVRGEGADLFAGEISMGGEGRLEAASGGTISGGPIQGGTIIATGNSSGRGTVASSEFSNNIILLDGGQIRAVEDNGDFIGRGNTIVLEEGGGYFDTDRRYVQILAPIEGEGSLTKVGKGALTLSGDLDYTGDTHVQEGGLYLGYASLKGSVKVAEGAFFGGIGSVGGSVHNAGFLDPGFSPGTIRIARDLTLESTAFVLLEIASKRNYDRLRIGGTARLDGKLRIYLLGGFEPEPGDEFAVLKAGKVKGEFSSVNPQFDAAIVGNELVVVWNGNRRAYQNAALTENQREAAAALEQLRANDLGSNSDFNRNVRPILDTLAPSELRQAFEAIAPAQSIAFSSAAFARSKTWLPQMATRLEYARSRPLESSLSSLGAADMKDVVVATPERLGVWLDGSGVFNRTASFDGLRTGDASSASGTVGVDYKLSDAFTVGAYTGYIGNWTNFGGGSEVNSNGTRFGVYSTWQSGGFYINSVVGGEWNAYDWQRRIAFPGLDRRASADTTGTVFETMFGGGYDWDITDRLKLGVFSGLEYTLLNVNGFSESGAKALDLKIDDQDADSLRTNLGAQMAWSIPIHARVLRPTLSAAWRHEYLDGSRGVGSQLVAGGGPGFNTGIPGSDRKDSLLLNGGFSMELTDNVTGYLYYTGDIDGTTDDVHSVNAGLRLQF